jgi:hypothetical protein
MKKSQVKLLVVGVGFLLILLTLTVLKQRTNLFSRAATNTLESESSALSGNLVSVTDSSASGGKYLQFGVSGGTTPVPSTVIPTGGTGTSAVIVAAGDISCGAGSGGAACKQLETSNLFVNNTALNPDAVLLLGDNQYESGVLSDYNTYLNSSWGRVINKVYPSIGNHEYNDPAGGAKGTFDYFEAKFGGPGNTTKRPGARNQGYYSFDVGSWHMVALNSNCSHAGGCGVGSAQETWLRADLAAHTQKCSLIFFHHPWWSSGGRAKEGAVLPLLQAFYDNNGDVILTGHDHTYERFAPQNPSGALDTARGMREFVVGTGGRNHTSLASRQPNSEVFDQSSFGVLKMTLNATGYTWQFIPIPGNSFTDNGTGTCH